MKLMPGQTRCLRIYPTEVVTTMSYLWQAGLTKNRLTLLHSEQPKLHRILAVLSAIGLKCPYTESVCSFASHSKPVKKDKTFL